MLMYSNMNLAKIPFLVTLLVSLYSPVKGHGYLIDPPARNSCWKVFKECETNYDLNGLNCGGYHRILQNGGKCGVCGDNYSNKKQPHVFPGKYATGFITKSYTQGQIITVKVIITANHEGSFQYRIGDIGNPPITQEKLKYLLKSTDNRTNFILPSSASSLTHQLVLPQDLVCDHCVLQWSWRAGNNWGCEGPNQCGRGRGSQETFVNCADVRITAMTSLPTPTPSPSPLITPGMSLSSQVTNPPTSVPITTPPYNRTHVSNSSTMSATSLPNPTSTATLPKKSDCKSTGAWAGDREMDRWCETHCAMGLCPSHMCTCGDESSKVNKCRSTGPWRGNPGMDGWCQTSCALGFCPSHICACEDDKQDLPTECKAKGLWEGSQNIDQWCQVNCAMGFCPENICACERPNE